MHVTFYATEKSREQGLAAAFQQGMRSFPDTCQILNPAHYRVPQSETDVAVIIGVKGHSRKLFDDHLAAGKHVVYLDKGYINRKRFYRMSIDSFQPLAYFQRISRPDDRLRAHHLHLEDMRTVGTSVILAGGSLKYAQWHHMPETPEADPMTTWARETGRQLRHYTTRPLIYRPKPSWQDAQSLPDMSFSRPPEYLSDLLPHCWALVTFGSNAAVEALIAGVPVIITGDGIAQPLAKQSPSSIENPYLPSLAERWQWLADLCYCQFSHAEIQQGCAWHILREEIVHGHCAFVHDPIHHA